MGNGGKYRAVLAANTGGHLAQLVQLSRKMDLQDDPLWITFDHPQSRSLLADANNVMFLPYMAPRDWRTALRTVPEILHALSKSKYDIVVSTGAAIAVPVFIAGLLKRIRPFYVESVSRFEGPSLTGRIVSWMPGVRLFSQHATWAGGRWRLGPSVLDDFELVQANTVPHDKAKIFVTLGTIRPYRFDRMVDAVQDLRAENWQITWQLGATTRNDLPGEVHETMTAEQVESHINNADVIISHAGVGSALSILRKGKVPVLVPRLSDHREHVDNHQLQIATELANRGLAVLVTEEQPLTEADIARVCTLAVRSAASPSAGSFR